MPQAGTRDSRVMQLLEVWQYPTERVASSTGIVVFEGTGALGAPWFTGWGHENEPETMEQGSIISQGVWSLRFSGSYKYSSPHFSSAPRQSGQPYLLCPAFRFSRVLSRTQDVMMCGTRGLVFKIAMRRKILKYILIHTVHAHSVLFCSLSFYFPLFWLYTLSSYSTTDAMCLTRAMCACRMCRLARRS